METVQVSERKSKGSGSQARPGSRARAKTHPSYAYEVRRRAVQLYLEEGFPAELVAREIGCSAHSLYEWVRAYREHGEAGLKPKRRNRGGTRLPAAVRDTIVEVKQARPWFGVKRISQFLGRVLFLSASPETVRKTLHEQGLIEKPKGKPKRNPGKPRFFERATPNQMWQSDILTFRLGGQNAYVIGFMDDYSRLLTGLELFRSQTADNVLEVYRRALGEYGVPREMLTDNGRQYTNWRGTTRFEKELAKDRVHHIKSRPHHPMTLGKIERFWKTLLGEFLTRAQFDSFEQARERTRLWVQYYNHRRPHQGIGGLCPADRFFEVHNELRQVIERGISENVLELALRGKPQRPFYMVGRLDGQSVVMEARKGKLVMTVNDPDKNRQEELVYDVNEGEVRHDEHTEADAPALHGAGEVSGGAGDLDRTPEHGAGGQGSAGVLVPAARVAGPGALGHAAGVGAEDQGDGPAEPAECETAEAAGEEGPGRASVGDGVGLAAETSGGGPGHPEADPLMVVLQAVQRRPELLADLLAVAQVDSLQYLGDGGDTVQAVERASVVVADGNGPQQPCEVSWAPVPAMGLAEPQATSASPREALSGDAHDPIAETAHVQELLITEPRPAAGAGAPACGTDREGAFRPGLGECGSRGTGCVQEDLLRMGEPRPERDDGGPGGPTDRTAEEASGCRDAGLGETGQRPGEEAGGERADGTNPRDAQRPAGARWFPA